MWKGAIGNFFTSAVMVAFQVPDRRVSGNCDLSCSSVHQRSGTFICQGCTELCGAVRSQSGHFHNGSAG